MYVQDLSKHEHKYNPLTPFLLKTQVYRTRIKIFAFFLDLISAGVRLVIQMKLFIKNIFHSLFLHIFFLKFQVYIRQGRGWRIAKHRFLVAWNGIKIRSSNTAFLFLLKKIVPKSALSSVRISIKTDVLECILLKWKYFWICVIIMH